MCFLGYPYAQKGWCVYDLKHKQLFTSRDVIFYGNLFPFHQSPQELSHEAHEFLGHGDIIHKAQHLVSPTDVAHFEEEQSFYNGSKVVSKVAASKQSNDLIEPTNPIEHKVIPTACLEIVEVRPKNSGPRSVIPNEPTISVTTNLGHP